MGADAASPFSDASGDAAPVRCLREEARSPAVGREHDACSIRRPDWVAVDIWLAGQPCERPCPDVSNPDVSVARVLDFNHDPRPVWRDSRVAVGTRFGWQGLLAPVPINPGQAERHVDARGVHKGAVARDVEMRGSSYRGRVQDPFDDGYSAAREASAIQIEGRGEEHSI